MSCPRIGIIDTPISNTNIHAMMNIVVENGRKKKQSEIEVETMTPDEKNLILLNERNVKHFKRGDKVKLIISGWWRRGTVRGVFLGRFSKLEVDVDVDGNVETMDIHSNAIWHT